MKPAENPQQNTGTRISRLTLAGLMTAVLCILGPLSIPLPFSPVPISLTNLAVFFAVYLLKIKGGTVCLLVYLCLGAVGLPVFSSFSGGLGKLAGPTGGYLIGFILLALIQGFLLAFQMELTFPAALTAGVLPYLPGDGIKIAIAAAAGPKLVSAIQRNSGLPY